MKNLMHKRMKKHIAIAGLLGASVLGAGQANAVYLQVVPTASSVNVGSTLQVDVTIGDLSDYSAPSLGAYDLSVLFDASQLQFTGVSWGTGLDVLQLGSLTQQDVSGASTGLVNFAEISFDDIVTLNDMQPAAFTLFSVYFTALAIGESQIALDALALGDAEGLALTADSITGADVAVVPLPAALPLLASGLLLLMGRLRRRA